MIMEMYSFLYWLVSSYGLWIWIDFSLIEGNDDVYLKDDVKNDGGYCYCYYLID